jgi:transcriptional regulator with XRE-family HTH domain
LETEKVSFADASYAKLYFTMTGPVLSPLTTEALRLLAASIKAGRLRRRWSINELAQRVGVSHPTIIKVERGDPTVAIATVLEAATLVGVALFDPDPVARLRHLGALTVELSLLPKAGRQSTAVADDDF